MRVVSDEIHASFVFDGRRHVSALSLSDRCVMLTSATKAFNLAGLRHSSNLFGMLAQRTAYEQGDRWLDQCVEYIQRNRDFAEAFFRKNLPEICLHPLEGTYLMWLDMRRRGLEHEEMFRRLIEVGGVGLNDGLFFGEQGRGFFRLNLATQRANLARGLEGIACAWR